MNMRALLLPALLALLVLSFAAPAQAQSASLMGRWHFETSKHPRMDCRISGVADFSRGAVRGTYAVLLNARQICTDDAREVTALEACTAARQDQHMTITCRLIRSSSENYIADNFVLDVHSGDLMTGRLDDARSWDVPVRFDRGSEDPLIS